MTTQQKWHTGISIVGVAVLGYGAMKYSSKKFIDKPAYVESMIWGGGILLFGNMMVPVAVELKKRII